MIQSDAVEAVLQGEHTLYFMSLDHAGEHIAHRHTLARTRQVVGHWENSAQIVRGVAPLRGQPGVVEIQPANHGADIECRGDRIQLVSRAGNPRAAREGRTRHQSIWCTPGTSMPESRKPAYPSSNKRRSHKRARS